MSLQKIKAFLVLATLLAFIPFSFYFLLFDDNIALSKYQGFASFSKRNWGGIVYNNTNQTMVITDYKKKYLLPPEKSSRDIGIFDADSLVIDKPMYFENKKYTNRVLKFCDYSRLRVVDENGKNVIKAKNKWICKLMDDFGIYNSVDEAF